MVDRRTACVPAFGGLTFPSVTAFQMSSAGMPSSTHGIVMSGESHRTMDDGSSYRMSRLSSLSTGRSVQQQISGRKAGTHVSGAYAFSSVLL